MFKHSKRNAIGHQEALLKILKCLVFIIKLVGKKIRKESSNHEELAEVHQG